MYAMTPSDPHGPITRHTTLYEDNLTSVNNEHKNIMTCKLVRYCKLLDFQTNHEQSEPTSIFN